MARNKGKAGDLEKMVGEILSQYREGVVESLDEATKKVAKEGVTELKDVSLSTFGGSGTYAKGWTSTVETGRVSAQGTIYNKTPGLPHLLENGHANRGGGRTPGRPHIAPVEEKIITAYQKEVEDAIN